MLHVSQQSRNLILLTDISILDVALQMVHGTNYLLLFLEYTCGELIAKWKTGFGFENWSREEIHPGCQVPPERCSLYSFHCQFSCIYYAVHRYTVNTLRRWNVFVFILCLHILYPKIPYGFRQTLLLRYQYDLHITQSSKCKFFF
jgi:ubiquitin C-terminal hydrolase